MKNLIRISAFLALMLFAIFFLFSVFVSSYFSLSAIQSGDSSQKKLVTEVGINTIEDSIKIFEQYQAEEKKMKIALASPFTSIKYRGVIPGNFDPDTRREMVVDFGSLGIWRYDAFLTPKWVRLYGGDPDFMIAQDYDYDGKDEIFAYFSSEQAIHVWDWVSWTDPDGQWTWNWVSGWDCTYMLRLFEGLPYKTYIAVQLHSGSTGQLYLANFESNSWNWHLIYNGRTYGGCILDYGAAITQHQLAAHFDTGGLKIWKYLSGDSDWTDNWTTITSSTPDMQDTIESKLCAGYPTHCLVVSILGQGLWKYDPFPSFQQINENTVLDIRAGSYGFGYGFMASFLAPPGLWTYDCGFVPYWKCLNALTPDTDGGFVTKYGPYLAVDYSNHGIGLWKYDYHGTPKWTPLNGNSPVYMVGANLGTVGSDMQLYVKFESPPGLWKYDDTTSPKWQRINGANPD